MQKGHQLKKKYGGDYYELWRYLATRSLLILTISWNNCSIWLRVIFLFGTEDIKEQFINTHKHNQAIIPQQNQIKTV